MDETTRLLQAAAAGDGLAAQQLLPLVYSELRQLAARQLAHERPGQTLDATALVHEAYLRLAWPKAEGERGRVGEGETGENLPLSPSPTPPLAPCFAGRRHFFFAAAQAMRRILIERARAASVRARRSAAAGRAGRCHGAERADELLALDAALERLAAREPQAAELVQLRYFAGCTMPQAADLLGLPLRSVERLWAYAKAFLLEELRGAS